MLIIDLDSVIQAIGLYLHMDKTEEIIRNPLQSSEPFKEGCIKIGKYNIQIKQQIKYLSSILRNRLNRPGTVRMGIAKSLAATHMTTSLI